MLREAIDEYHDLLDEELAAESQHRLDDQLRRRGLFFGDRALCTVLRPRFLSAAQYRFLQRRAGLVLRAFHTAYGAAVDDERLLAQFKLSDWECTLIRHDPGFRDPVRYRGSTHSSSARAAAFASPSTTRKRPPAARTMTS